MARRTTTIGIGAFGNWTDHGEHLKYTYRRIRSQQMTLTEDAVFVIDLPPAVAPPTELEFRAS